MRRTLIITHEKRGSTFLMSMLFGEPGEFAFNEKQFKTKDFPIWLNTVPPQQCKFYYHGDPKYRQLEDRIYARPDVNTMEAYTWVSPANLDQKFYDQLPGNDWRFVYLLRDPRNTITSLCKRSQLVDEKLDDMFRVQCGYFQDELGGLNAVKRDPRFYLLRFEQFIVTPVDTMVEMFGHMGLQIDRNFYQEIADQYAAGYINTSFQDQGKGSRRRWDSWSDEWRTHYNNEVGPGLRHLGIPEYLEW